MDPRLSAQDILRCTLCDTPIPLMYCVFCQVNLCKLCVGEHLSDLSTEHKVVPFNRRGFIPKLPICRDHEMKHCELYCENCDIPVCLLCVSSDKHQGHKISNTLENFSSRKELLKKDLKLLEEVISPKYEKLVSELEIQEGVIEENYNELTLAVVKHGEDWRRHVDIAVNNRKSEIEENKTKHIFALNKHK
ncbi:E3 ubiquitin-protein ligase TRIM36-like, partial [Saccostrea cucullata]|uniref:E3 ubiquitin-protein ligase TRIM36-like n=1 Tax=Saccostrea cuccullata TaxID=36930 RepID=UPI002ED460DE